MKGTTWNWLPFLMVLMAAEVALQHGTCDNEKRWENQVMCLNHPFGALVPYPDNCTLFLVCNCEYPTVKQCPANLWWDSVHTTCNYPHATKCIYYDFQTRPTETTQTATTPSLDNTTLPITSTTEEYVSTTWNTTAEPLTTTWSTTEYLTTTSEAPPTPPPGVNETFCKDLRDGSIWKYDYDCNAYINCTNGWPVLNYCQPDKVLNDRLKICDTPGSAECEPLPLPPSTLKPTTEIPTTTAVPLTTDPTTTTEKPGTTTVQPTTTTAKPTTTTAEATTNTVEPIASTAEPNTITERPWTTTDDVQCTDLPPLGIADDYCEPKGNGFYEYPYDCNAYLSCNKGCTHYAYCITGKLFNPVLHICDTPNSVKCHPQPYSNTTTVSITSESSSSDGDKRTTPISTTTAGLPENVNPNMCKNKADSTRYPSAADCAEYFQCQNNQVIAAKCPEPMVFNSVFGICDDKESVHCYGDRTTSTSTSSTTPQPTTTTRTTSSTTLSTLPSTTVGPAEYCADKEFGITFSDVKDCAMYFICLGDGTFYLAPCIMGTYYNPKTGQCDGSPTACQEQSTATTVLAATTTTTATTVELVISTISTPTTSATSTTSVTPAPTGGICTAKDEGKMIAYPKECSKYIVCVSPIPVAFFCMEGFFFNVKQQQCIPWADSDCGLETSSTPAFTQPPLQPNMCTNSSRYTFPYPENCQWFIRCVDDNIYMMDVCQCNEYYDPIRGECGANVPSDACRWDYTSTTPEPTATTLPETRPPPQKGPCDDAANGEMVPYPNDCSKYIKCNRPIPAAFDCAEGLEFSPKSHQCMKASLANCNIDPNPGGPTVNWSDSTTSSYTTSAEHSPTASSATQELLTNPPTEPNTTEQSSTTEQTRLWDLTTTEEAFTTEQNPPTESRTTQEPTADPYISTTEVITEITPTERPSEGICGDKKNGTEVPYPNNCSKYIICQEPIPVGYDCPEGLEFSPTDLACMDPDLANCSPKPTTSTSFETTDATTPAPVTIHPNTPNICCGQPLGTYLAYPNDCNRYVVCDYPVPQVIVCEEGTAFDEKYLQCTVWAQENVCN